MLCFVIFLQKFTLCQSRVARSEGGRLLREQHARKIHFLCRRQRHKKLVGAVPAESVRRSAAERTQLEKLILFFYLVIPNLW